MRQLYEQLRAAPRLTAALCAATLLINILAFGDIIFVMLILRRYVAHGFEGTLILLTLGALAALGLQYVCKEARAALACDVGAARDRALSRDAFRALVRSRAAALHALSASRTRELPGLLSDSQAGADAMIVSSFLEFPFSIVFVAATAVLSPVLGLIVLVGMWMSLASGTRGRAGTADTAVAVQEEMAANRSLIGSAATWADTVRVFRGGRFYQELWRDQVRRLARLRGRASDERGLSQSAQATVGVFVRVAIYAVGAKLVVEGQMTFASLIGASMLGSYAVAKASMLVQARTMAGRAAEADAGIAQVLDLPQEPWGGPAPQGSDLRLAGVSFAYPGARGPLFEGLDLDIPQGTVVAAHGYNGSGKTTLARLVVGLLSPTAGDILVGGVSAAEADAALWRANIVYMPQEAEFLAATMRENLTMANPGLEEAELNRILRLAGLRRFLDTSEKGLETPMPDAGRSLPLGIRRRMGLARGMATLGGLVILDEPTEGLDAEGVQAVYAAVKEFMAQGRTILALTADPGLRRAAHLVLDLGVKPTPAVRVQRQAAFGREDGP